MTALLPDDRRGVAAAEGLRGACVVVARRSGRGHEVLVLHRSGAAPAGDWAWTPPSGVAEPGETAKACARRELAEETGLCLACVPTAFGSPAWPVFLALAEPGATVVLSDEHDALAWLDPAEAAARCRPVEVGGAVARVASLLDQRP